MSVHAGEPDSKGRRISPWAWVPTVYFAQGLQYAIVVQLFAIVFFTMGVPQGDTLFWVGLLSFPWTIKPLWGPLVDKYGTKRAWTYVMQFLVGICFVGTALSLLVPGNEARGFLNIPWFMYGCIIFLGLLAFAAATHDIACDGYYMLGLSEKQQAFYVGVRSTLFRAALIFANGILIWIAGVVQTGTGLPAVDAELRVVAPDESAQVASPPSLDEVFATQVWPGADQEAILVMPSVLEGKPGETNYVSVRLSQPPPEGEERVVVLRLMEADKGISVPKDKTRLIFNQDNWQTGFDIPVTSDERLKADAVDVLRVQAGNIPFSWTVVTLICAGVFVIVAVWHRFILPYPSQDRTDTTDRPPFIVPLVCLLLTIGIPFAASVGVMKGLALLKTPLQVATVGNVKSPALQDIREYLIDDEADEFDVTTEQVGQTIESMRNDQIARSAENLKAIIAMRRILQDNGLLGNDAAVPRLMQFIIASSQNPDLYGNATLKRLVVQLKVLNDGKLPESEEQLADLLSRAENPALAELPEDPENDLYTTLIKFEGFYGGYVQPRIQLAKDIRAANGGNLPQSGDELEKIVLGQNIDATKLLTGGDYDRLLEEMKEAEQNFPNALPEGGEQYAAKLPNNQQEVQSVIALASTTPSKLTVKGYSSFFTVGRMLVLLLLLAIIIKVPIFWQPVKSAIYFASNVSRIGFADVFATFFEKSGMPIVLGFLLTFRLGEAQLAQVKNLFLLDTREAGGLAMSLGELAFTNSVVYLVALTVGGLLGGILIARTGLKRIIWIMVAFMHLPNLGYYVLSVTDTSNLAFINSIVGFESFGYGFGFTAYLMVMILAAQGPYKTAHYALCTGAMALGYMIPGMWAGYLQELVGYETFFLLVMIFCLPGVIFIPFLKIDPTFGKKSTAT